MLSTTRRGPGVVSDVGDRGYVRNVLTAGLVGVFRSRPARVRPGCMAAAMASRSVTAAGVCCRLPMALPPSRRGDRSRHRRRRG